MEARSPGGSGPLTGAGPPPRVRVAIHSAGGTFGGTETWAARAAAGLQARGHQVRLFCRDDAMAERFRSWGFPVTVARIGGNLMLPHAASFARRLRAFEPDALLLLTFRKVFLAGLAARLAGVPLVVFRVANQGTVPTDALYRFAFRRFVDLVSCNADALRTPFLEHAPGFDPARALTIYDGVEPETPGRGPGAVKRELGIPDGALVVGSVGRLVGQKRYDRLVAAMGDLPGVHCVIAGDGEDRAELEALIAAGGLTERVHLLGFRDDVPDVLASMDVFVLTSQFEGMSNAMLEAMSQGIPVVSTPVSGAAEALDPAGEEPAGIVTDHDTRSVARALATLQTDAPLRARMGAAARRRFDEAFGFERMLDAWERLLAGEDPRTIHQGPQGATSHTGSSS